MSEQYTVYGHVKSGNCFKIKLLMEFLGVEYEWHSINILAGETRTDEFAKLSPKKKIPVLQLSDGKVLTESNAILNYLADGTSFLPDDRWARAQTLEWQSFEQYSHEPYIAVARFIKYFLKLPQERLEEFQSKQAGGNKALTIMDQHLDNRRFFVGETPTVADISLYGYTHVADEGGFDLNAYSNVCAWIQRIQNIPGYVSMDD